jgi:hypothetical protein
VANHPSFDVLLARLLKHRGTDITWLSASCGVAESEIRPVIDGAAPDESLLRALAPALGFHAADLFVMADVPVPEDLAPLDQAAGHDMRRLVKVAMALPQGQRLRIHQLVGELPQAPRPRSEPVKPYMIFNQSEAGFGAMLISMLCGNRNLRSPSDAAWVVGLLTRGRMYLSASTYLVIGHGRTPVRPRWVADFAAVLGIPAGDLAAITGIALPGEPLRDDPLASEMAELIWNARRLSAAQARHVHDEANAMLVAVPDDAPEQEWNRVYHQHGVWWGAPRTDED